MTLAEFDEEYGVHIDCGDCKHYWHNCKRIDHKHICFVKGPFASYNYGSGSGNSHCICNDFELNTIYKLLKEKWQPEWKEELLQRYKGTMRVCLDENFETRYEIRVDDFKKNTFLNEDGSLKWLRKQYYKRSRKSPIGYVFINEYPDGYIQEKANQPLLWEHTGQEK